MTSDIKKYSFKQGLPQEFELVGIGHLINEFSDNLTTVHRTGFYHILWFQKGNPTHLVDFEPVNIKSNTILFLNKDQVQRFDKQGKFDGKAILFTDSFFLQDRAGYQISQKHHFIQRPLFGFSNSATKNEQGICRRISANGD